ncbi:MAG: outer membrane protein assembly factor BamA [Bacteroidetes bacterium GWF2_33_16]|nr:MAG: outer membrane protein assembly factor BamA [Bacteroidetes bacterium GWE2_32_14]OFY08840.1 MAG: outer membrane protein assembly factor BamA [Bacteroidetes bacterium GWF2_33_16]
MTRRFVLSIIILFLGIQLLAQEQTDFSSLNVIDYKKPNDYIIKDITISGVKYLDKNILITLSGLTIQRQITIPGEDITRAVEKLWKQGLFSDIKITTAEIQGDSIILDIYLQERPRLSELEIIGVKKSHEKDLREALELKRGVQVTENTINKAKGSIRDFLYNKKYLNAKIDIYQSDDTISRQNNVNLKVVIDRGSKVKIKEINFVGNEVITDAKLRRKMKETKRRDLNIFKASKFIESDYKDDKEKVIAAYNEKGYRDAEIIRDSIYKISDKRIGIQIEIFEGNQYFFRNIDWVGNTKYSASLLDVALKIKKGDPYDTEMLNKRLNIDEDAVSSLYLDNGYLFFNCNPTIMKIDGDSIDLQMRIYEGKRVRLNNIIIKGNDKTNEHVVRRELRTKPGELFSKSEIMRSQREIAQLGHFDPEQFGIEPININQAEGTVDLEYTLVEKSNDQLEIAGGWGANMFIGTIGLRFSNFSIGRVLKKDAWKPIPSGDGQTLSLRVQTNGEYYSAYSFSFVDPWFGGRKPNSFSVSFYHTVRKNTNYVYEVSDEFIKVTGATVGLGQRLKWPDDYFTISNSINYQLYRLNDWTGFIMSNGNANNLSISTTFARNSIDWPIYPRRGSQFSLTLQITPPYSLFKDEKWWTLSQAQIDTIVSTETAEYRSSTGLPLEYFVSAAIKDKENQSKYNWMEYHKWKYKGSWYIKIWKDMVLAANTEFGYLGYFNKDVGHAPFGKFKLGGDGLSGYNMYDEEYIGLRGYENSSLTPPYNSNYKNGNVYEKINFELRYPISLKPQAVIYVLGFVEAGNSWESLDNFNPFKVKRSAGIGLRAFLPMFGLLGVDWGYGFDEIPGNADANGSQFHFVIGQQF